MSLGPLEFLLILIPFLILAGIIAIVVTVSYTHLTLPTKA